MVVDRPNSFAIRGLSIFMQSDLSGVSIRGFIPVTPTRNRLQSASRPYFAATASIYFAPRNP